MVWNESNNDNDPWKKPGQRPGNNGGGGGNNGQRPPDLDEVMKKIQKGFGSVIGGSGGGGSEVPPMPGFLKIVILLALIAMLLASSLFTVDAGSTGVVQRFGEFTHEAPPGLNWRIPVVDKVTIVRSDLSRELNSNSEMLTGDANIITVDINVQYRHADAKAVVFNVRDPDDTLSEVADAAIRAIVGKYTLEEIQREKREQVATETRERIQINLDSYGTGIVVDALNLNKTEFPKQVQAAAQDVIKAARDKERFILQAEAYKLDLIPRAGGEATKKLEEAAGYRDGLIADAMGEANRFKALLIQFELAPEVTRERLYLEAVEDVLGSTSKVLMDTEGSGNMLYLPVDKLIENAQRNSDQRTSDKQQQSGGKSQSTMVPTAPTSTTSSRSRSRDRK